MERFEMVHDDTLFRHTTQNRMQLKTHGLFASGILHFNLFRPQVSVGNHKCAKYKGG